MALEGIEPCISGVKSQRTEPLSYRAKRRLSSLERTEGVEPTSYRVAICSQAAWWHAKSANKKMNLGAIIKCDNQSSNGSQKKLVSKNL